ncbi:hypothetical protein [Paratractidigestivibacter sp.]|uniref:hypothetical protein n=1 Tax=Paratractidigestivibacter sp. TaxID=2847316 RepID=UPI002AC9E2A2|nr:hypothetical protein [Paratractidigestivibacter sp.]
MGDSYQLPKVVLEASSSKVWDTAIAEWHIVSCHDNGDASGDCLCGHEGIRYECTIRNSVNGNELSPIGSTCILKFANDDLKKEIEGWKAAIKLLEALETRRPGVVLDGLNRDFFSHRLYTFLYEKGAFPANRYNGYDGKNDYEFMVDMFNKRTPPTEKQRNKIYMVLNNGIFPWLTLFRDELREGRL